MKSYKPEVIAASSDRQEQDEREFVMDCIYEALDGWRMDDDLERIVAEEVFDRLERFDLDNDESDPPGRWYFALACLQVVAEITMSNQPARRSPGTVCDSPTRAG